MSKRVIDKGSNYTVTAKKPFQKLDAEVVLQNEEVAIYKEIFSHTSVNIVNVKTFDGLDINQAMSCCGFTEDGKPILTDRDDMKIKYHVFGSKVGDGFMTPTYNNGRKQVLYVRGEKVIRESKGFEALAECFGISPQKMQTEIEAMLDAGNRKIYIRFLHNLLGLEQSFGLFEDTIIFSGESWSHHEPDFNEVWNKVLLPKLKSEWRVLTPEIRAMLEAKRDRELEKEFGET